MIEKDRKVATFGRCSECSEPVYKASWPGSFAENNWVIEYNTRQRNIHNMSPTTFPAEWLPFPSFCLWALVVKYCQWAGFSSWVLAKCRQHIPSEAPDNNYVVQHGFTYAAVASARKHAQRIMPLVIQNEMMNAQNEPQEFRCATVACSAAKGPCALPALFASIST